MIRTQIFMPIALALVAVALSLTEKANAADLLPKDSHRLAKVARKRGPFKKPLLPPGDYIKKDGFQPGLKIKRPAGSYFDPSGFHPSGSKSHLPAGSYFDPSGFHKNGATPQLPAGGYFNPGGFHPSDGQPVPAGVDVPEDHPPIPPPK